MSKIHQIQFQFLPIEDRLLLKMNTTSNEEFRFILTRRFVSLLYPILSKILDTNISNTPSNKKAPNTAKQATEQISQKIANQQQQDAKKKPDTSQPYQSNGLTQPLGKQPILLANISTQESDNNLSLSLTPKNGLGISFIVDQDLTHLLRNLLLESLKFADWQLGFQTNLISPTTENMPQSDKRTLH